MTLTEQTAPTALLDEMPEERRALVQGLYQLAEWVTAHRDLPLPRVEARVPTYQLKTWEQECALVDEVAAALGATPDLHNGHYEAAGRFGPVGVSAVAITDERMAAWEALTSYSGSVIPDATKQTGEPS